MDPVTRIAAFDLDHTMVRRDLVMPFLRHAAGDIRVLRAVSRASTVRAVLRRDRNALKAAATTSLAGLALPVIDRSARVIASAATTRFLHPVTAQMWRAEGEAGSKRVIVSASYEPYVSRIGEHLAADAVLATQLEVVDGHATGKLAGVNCRGPEKVRRLQELLSRWGLERDSVVIAAWGDSAGDRDMLAWADEPWRVSRSRVTPA